MNQLRCCAKCSAHILTNDGTTESVYCPRCAKALPSFEAWAATLAKGSKVFVQPSVVGPNFARTEHIVITREGDAFTLQPLGFPGRRVETTLGQLAPERVAGRW